MKLLQHGINQCSLRCQPPYICSIETALNQSPPLQAATDALLEDLNGTGYIGCTDRIRMLMGRMPVETVCLIRGRWAIGSG